MNFNNMNMPELPFDVPFNRYNVLNVVAFLLSWLMNSEVALDVGPGGKEFYFFEGMRDLGRRLESIVTPAAFTFLTSHLVLMVQGVFTIAQLLPKYRSHTLVEDGVGYRFFISALVQLAWCMNTGLENAFGAFMAPVYMAFMVFCNARILMAQANIANNDPHQTPEEFWLLRFPFSLGTGWNIAVFIMCANAFFHFLEVANGLQLFFGLLSLAGYAAISAKMLMLNAGKPNYAIPAVLAWFLIGIAFDGEPKGGVEDIFSLGFTIISATLGIAIAGATGFIYYTKEIINRAGKEDVKDSSYEAPAAQVA